MLKGVKVLDGVIVSGIQYNADLKILDLKGWNRIEWSGSETNANRLSDGWIEWYDGKSCICKRSMQKQRRVHTEKYRDLKGATIF